MVDSYENVPVFRSGMRQDIPESVIGKATVQIDQENGKSTITIEGGPEITEFMSLGTLRSFDLNTAVLDLDPVKVKAWWSRQP